MNTRAPSSIRGTTTDHLLEDVSHYPRPPSLEKISYPISIVLGGETIVATTAAYRVLETYHPPTYYLPPDDVVPGTLIPTSGQSLCEWKGSARYFNVKGGTKLIESAAWSYPRPFDGFAAIRDHVAFYCDPMDQCLVDGIAAEPQPGNFYGGWVTPWTIGPIKGAPGTRHW